MKMVKSLLLGTAAGFVVVAGAQAADMPVKARPVQYVKICTLYGDGYYYIPGSDTCIKIGGFVQLDIASGGTANAAINYSGSAGAQDRSVSNLTTRAYTNLAIDTRTQTQYGTLRTLNVFKILNQNGGETTNNIRDFVQWAGFTLGRMDSFADTWKYGDSYGLAQPQIGMDQGSNGVNAVAYTFEFGNGVTLTFAADERTTKGLTNLSVNSALHVGSEPLDSHAGQQFYTPYVNLRVDQAWGHVSATGGIQDDSATYYTNSFGTSITSGVPGYSGSCGSGGTGTQFGAANLPLTQCGHPANKLGWYAGIGGEIMLPFISPGDKIGAAAGYAQGAGFFGNGNNFGSPDIFSGQSVANSFETDGVYVNGSGIDLTTSWRVAAGYQHHWTPTLDTSIYAGYSQTLYDAQAQAYFGDAIGCTTAGTGAALQTSINVKTSGGSGSNCNPNYAMLELGTRTTWTPVPGLLFQVSEVYTFINTGFGGDNMFLSNAGASPVVAGTDRAAGVYQYANQGIWATYFRVKRLFNTD
jgi:hypothetical protein